MDTFSTPILFLIFNRPDATKLVFEEIRQQRPQYFYIAADGPREDKVGEQELCGLARKVVSQIDWDCEVKTLFREKNLGCGKAVSEAITWFFDNVEEGIILEDDCLPNESFFYFCEELLDQYKHNEEVMHISGVNLLNKNNGIKQSYYFSNYVHVWGWATWRTAWKKYNFNIPHVKDERFQAILDAKFLNKIEKGYWEKSFQGMAEHNIDTWDIQWVYSIYKNHGLTVTPTVNLVSNIGFGSDATHTLTFDGKYANIPTYLIPKIQHFSKIKVLEKADRITFKKFYQFGDTHFNRIKFKIGKRFPLIKNLYLKLKKD